MLEEEDPGRMDVLGHSEYLEVETFGDCSEMILQDSKMLTGCFLRYTWDKPKKSEMSNRNSKCHGG